MSVRKLENDVRAPSPRDLKIYELVTYQPVSQRTVGQVFGLSQARVSQICRAVRTYLALAGPVEIAPLAEREEAELARLELLAQKEMLRDHAMWAVNNAEQTQQTQKQFQRDEKGRVLQETVTRPAKGDMRAVREASRQCEEIAELRGVSVKRRGRRSEAGSQKTEVAGQKTEPSKLPWSNHPDAVPPLLIPLASDPGTYTAYRPEVNYSLQFGLSQVAEGRATLADIETSNRREARSTGWLYPSLFEKCAKSINGVRVADWVRQHVPEEKLPQGDDVRLPEEHCLADFEARSAEPGARSVEVVGWAAPTDACQVAVDPTPAVPADASESSGGPSPPYFLDTLAPSHPGDCRTKTDATAPRGPTRIERLLASDRVICGPLRRRLERRARRGG